ncbi:MAG: hypothetical protein E7284_05575 [Lachnospiraceae bacterium]|nr:hypothetical protein [Lachnospiraceae bacterium]
MKKLLVALLFVTMSFTLFGCGKTNEENVPSDEVVSEENTEDVSEENTENVSEDSSESVVASDNGSVTILSDVWNTYAEDEKFAVMGGDFENMVDGAPGAFDVTNVENMSGTFQIPADIAGNIDEGASLVHAMNANTFTGAALHLADVSAMEAFTTSLKDGIMGTQWMCGFPDTLIIFTVNNEYVVYAYGNAEVIDNFKNKVTEVYGENAVLVAEESLAG